MAMMKLLASDTAWLSCMRRYLLFLGVANLLWETLHMPLYALWSEGTIAQIIGYGLHCVGGDLLIGSASLLLALVLFAKSDWPITSYWRVAICTTLMGLSYTLWSEWYNVMIAGRWAYSDAMPTIAVIGVGVSPLAQWLAIPSAGFWWAKQR